MSSFVVWCLVLFSLSNSRLLDPLDDKSVSNDEAACNDLITEATCVKAGPCVWGSGTPSCTQDPCFERSLTTTSACKTISDGTCSRVPKVGSGGASHFCVNTTRLGSFTTQDQICSLEWGGWKLVELAACKTLSTQSYGCGPVKKLEGKDDNHYVCEFGTPPESPCNKIKSEDLCTYVGDCLWDNTPTGGDSVVGCVGDECWEKTYTSGDNCKTNIEGVTCNKHILNSGGTPEYGYCKTGSHDLHSKCNVGTATNILSKQAVCTWAGTNIPADCNKVATINNYDDETLYVCNPTGEEFDVDGANSLKSFAVGLFTAILLIAML